MKKHKLLYQDKLFADEVVKTKDPTKAMLNLHPEISDKKIAGAMARHRLESSIDVRHYISEALDRQGLSLLEANNRLKRLLDAKKGIVVGNEIVEIQDNGTRIQALDKLYKLHGLLKTDQTFQDNRQVNISLDNLSDEKLAKLDGILNEMQLLASRVDLTKNKVVAQVIDTQLDTQDSKLT